MTIFGNGFIAKNLKKLNLPNKFFIYAAGVSNSNIKQNKFYLREIKQFYIIKKKINSEKIFVYISSLSVENKSLKHDKYVKNKLIIESIIKKEVKKPLFLTYRDHFR